MSTKVELDRWRDDLGAWAIVAERGGGGEVDRIKCSQDTGLQGASAVEDAVGHGNELNTSEGRPRVSEDLRDSGSVTTSFTNAELSRWTATSYHGPR